MRLIDADKFLAQIEDQYMEHDITRAQYLDLENRILEQPIVDAVPVVHGRWQWISSTYDRVPCEKRYWCSKCHHETITHDSEPWEKFCPNCGARMDGKDGDHEEAD